MSFTRLCHCWKYARVAGLSLQAGSVITLEDDVAVHGECFPVGREFFDDSSCLCLWCCNAAPSRYGFRFSSRVVLTSIGVLYSIITFALTC